MGMLWLWASLVAAALIICAAEPEATINAVSAVLSALGTWPLWAVTQVRDGAERVILRILDHRAARSNEQYHLDGRAHASPVAPSDDADVAHATTDGEKAESEAARGEEREVASGSPSTPHHLLAQGSSLAVTLLDRLLNLLVAVAVVLGLLSLDFLRASLVTLGVAADLPLVPPAAAMGMLFAALPVLFGALLLESLDVIPPNTHLFPGLHANPQAKRFFDWAVRVACVLTLCMEVIVFVDSWLLLQQMHVLLLEGVLAAITGVLVVMAGVPAFNVLKQARQTPQETAAWVWNALTRAWSGLAGGAAPTMQQVMESGLVVLSENQRPITELHRLLTDPPYRAQLMAQVRDEQVQQFFTWYDGVGRRSGVLSESALRRAYNLSFAPPLRYSLGAAENDLDLRTCMDQGISVLCDLGGLDEETQRLLGCLLTAQAETAALSRADLPEHARRPAFLILDEWANFAAQSEVAMERMLAQCRKYALSVTLCCQALGQARHLQAALQNCLPIVLRLGGLDSDWGAARVGTYDPSKVKYTASGHPTSVSRGEQQQEWAERLERLPARHGVVRLGEESIPFYTLGLPAVRGGEQVLATLTARYSQLLLQPAAATTTNPTTRAGDDRPDTPSDPPRRPPLAEPPVRRVIPWPGQRRANRGETTR